MILDPSHDAPVEGPACKPCHGRTLSCGSQLFTFQRSGHPIQNLPGSEPVESVSNGGGQSRPQPQLQSSRQTDSFRESGGKGLGRAYLHPSHPFRLWIGGGKLARRPWNPRQRGPAGPGLPAWRSCRLARGPARRRRPGPRPRWAPPLGPVLSAPCSGRGRLPSSWRRWSGRRR